MVGGDWEEGVGLKAERKLPYSKFQYLIDTIYIRSGAQEKSRIVSLCEALQSASSFGLQQRTENVKNESRKSLNII